MEEVNKKLYATYNLEAEPLLFDSTTLFISNIPSYFTNETFLSLMSENGRRVSKYQLFPPKNNDSTTVGLVTYMSRNAAEDAIYWLNGTAPHIFQVKYAKYSVKDIKNFCNPWWNAACEEAYAYQKKAMNKYNQRPDPKSLIDYKKAKCAFRMVRRKYMKEHVESLARKTSVENKNTKSREETVSVPEPEVVQIKEERSDDTFTFSSSPNLETIRQEVSKFAEERNWNTYHQPRNLLLALVGEMGELSELFQWKGEVQPGLPGWTDKEKEHLGEELSDVLIYLIRLSDKCQIDLPSAAMKKIATNAKKYPATKVYGSSKKYTEYQDNS